MSTIPYHEAKELIETRIAEYTANAGDQELYPIEITRAEKKTSVKFELSQHTDLYQIIQILSQYLGEMEINQSAGSSLYLRGKGRWIYLDNNAYLGKSVRFSKDDDLTSEEVEAILEAYKIGNMIEGRIDPKQRLLQSGVHIYDADQSLGWDHIAGYEGMKREVIDTVILSLDHPETYEDIISKTRVNPKSPRPKAVLFEGPPGTGKTTCARIIGAQVDIPLVYVPIESIMTKWYSESASNLANVFDICDELGSTLIFLDEIDSLARSREDRIHEETQRVLSVLLRKIDGFDSKGKSILIGATNRKDDLDPALLRRFDATIHFPLPDNSERKAIYAMYAKQLDKPALERLAKESDGLSGSDIESLCGRTERRWASKRIRKVVEIDIPPLDEYLASLKDSENKKNGYVRLLNDSRL